MESWHIKAREHQCSVTEVPFEDGEEFYTALLPDPESSGYLRKDFSRKGWNEHEAAAETEAFSVWKSHYKAPVSEEKAVVMEKESAETLLQRLIEEDADHTENTRYILAVMLERQKLLKETDSQPTPTGILRIYEHRKTGEVYIVKDPNIPLSEVEAVQIEVMEMLDPKKPEEEESSSEVGEAVGEVSVETAESEEAGGGEGEELPDDEDAISDEGQPFSSGEEE